MPREFYPVPLEDETELVTLEDGWKWANAVLNDLENANWHDAREALQPLIWLLPEIYIVLETFGYHKLASKLQKSVDSWDTYF